MKFKTINSSIAPQASGGYSQALEVRETQRFLFISGQIPQTQPALTVVIAGIFDERWLLEIEAIAAA